MNILLTGASGFIGSALRQRLPAGDRVYALSRRPQRLRGGGIPIAAVAQIDAPLDAVINLAGENIGARRWSAARRRALRESRIDFTGQLGEQLAAAGQRPTVWINASAVGYYGDRPGVALTEAAPAGRDFAAQLCADWEQAAAIAAQRVGATRLCLLRLGVVLGAGGMLARLRLPFALGLGAVLGPGHQQMAWIGLDDGVEVLSRALRDPAYSGSFNLVAPQTLSQQDFAAALARALRRPLLLRLPAPVLRLLMGAMADLLLFDQQVLPARLQRLGFEFRQPDAGTALRALLQHHG